MLKLLTFFPDARIDSVTLRDFRIFKPSAGKLFIQPFTERSTQGQYRVNRKNGESTVIMNNAPFLRICAETAHYDKKTPKNMILLYIHISCAGSQLLPENQLGHGGGFRSANRVIIIFVGPKCSCGPKPISKP